MLIELAGPWFAPSVPARLDRARFVSGTYFPSGVHEVPDELEKFLPSSATILKGKTPTEPAKPAKESLKDHDIERAAAEAEAVIIDEVDETLTGLEKARAVRRRNMALRKHGLME